MCVCRLYPPTHLVLVAELTVTPCRARTPHDDDIALPLHAVVDLLWTPGSLLSRWQTLLLLTPRRNLKLSRCPCLVCRMRCCSRFCNTWT